MSEEDTRREEVKDLEAGRGPGQQGGPAEAGRADAGEAAEERAGAGGREPARESPGATRRDGEARLRARGVRAAHQQDEPFRDALGWRDDANGCPGPPRLPDAALWEPEDPRERGIRQGTPLRAGGDPHPVRRRGRTPEAQDGRAGPREARARHL